jgi:HEAT repeat protein
MRAAESRAAESRAARIARIRPELAEAEGAADEPVVLRSYREWTIQETAADALGRIGTAAVPELVGALAHPDPEVRRQASRVLARIGPGAAVAVPVLRQLLVDQDSTVRQAAIRALGQIGPPAAAAVPDLMILLESTAEQSGDADPAGASRESASTLPPEYRRPE